MPASRYDDGGGGGEFREFYIGSLFSDAPRFIGRGALSCPSKFLHKPSAPHSEARGGVIMSMLQPRWLMGGDGPADPFLQAFVMIVVSEIGEFRPFSLNPSCMLMDVFSLFRGQDVPDSCDHGHTACQKHRLWWSLRVPRGHVDPQRSAGQSHFRLDTKSGPSLSSVSVAQLTLSRYGRYGLLPSFFSVLAPRCSKKPCRCRPATCKMR